MMDLRARPQGRAAGTARCGRRYFERVLLAAATVVIVSSSDCGSVASADQNDARLDTLFVQLKQAGGPDEGARITQEIWDVWYHVPDEEAQSMFDKGVRFMAESDFRSSLMVFTKVIEMQPAFAEGWNRRATLLYLLGAFDLSIKDIEKTLELEPRHFGAIAGLGQIYMRRGKYSMARKEFEKALEINPHLEGVQVNIRQIDKLMSERSI